MDKNNLLWCIECERIVPNWATPLEVPYHVNVALTFDDVDLMNCYGPFTFSTPPAYPENWNEIVEEPDAEELSLIDANADLLLADLEII